MALGSIGGPFTRSSLYFTSPEARFPALVSQRWVSGQTAALPTKGKKLSPPKSFLLPQREKPPRKE